MKRAWAFQEEFLPPRVLYWTDHGIFWNCVLKQYAEHDALTPLDPLIRRSNWNQTIKAYTVRNLSHQQHRLTALAGVASKFSPAMHDEYLAPGVTLLCHSHCIAAVGQFEGLNLYDDLIGSINPLDPTKSKMNGLLQTRSQTARRVAQTT